MARGKGGATVDQVELEIAIPDSALTMDIQYIPWELIHPDPEQPRQHADAELRGSIAQGGIRQAITVRTHPELIGQWMIVDGERRWRSAEGVQAMIPSVVRDDVQAGGERLRDQLVSNSGKPLTPVEEARVLGRIKSEQGFTTVKDLAQFVGLKISTVSQRLNLLEIGPWLPIIEAGVIKYTHAAEVLLPYRGCPDAVHEAVIAELGKRRVLAIDADDLLSAEEQLEEIQYESAWRFENDVDPLYRKHLYPIAKQKGDDRPTFNTSTHDAECTCGGVVIEEKHSIQKRRFCGNPDWWKPLEREAKKVEKKKAAASSASSSAASKEVAKAFYAPEGVKDLGETGHLDVPKGYARLVGYSGKYSTLDNGRPFDPADLGEIAESDLAVQGKGAYRQLLVKESASLERARDKYAARLEAATAPVMKKFNAKLEKAIDVAVRRDSARALLAVALAGSDSYYGDDIEDLDEVLCYAGASLNLEEGTPDGAVGWEELLAEHLTDAQAAAALEALVTLRRWGKGEKPTVNDEIAKIETEMRAAIEKRKHPWSSPPKAKTGKSK